MKVCVTENRVERAGGVLDEELYRRLPIVERYTRALFQLRAVLVLVKIMLLPEKKTCSQMGEENKSQL